MLVNPLLHGDSSVSILSRVVAGIHHTRQKTYISPFKVLDEARKRR